MDMAFEGSEAEADLLSWVAESDVEVVTSAYFKLELGMATEQEQMMMATFIQKMKALIKECGIDD